MNLLRSVLVTLVLISVGATSAGAFGAIGEIWTGNSWGQRFDHTTGFSFDCVRIDWVHGSDFELPTVFENFSDDHWAASWETNILASARGYGEQSLSFDIIFNGDVIPTAFTFATYRNGEHQEFFRADFSGDVDHGEWQVNLCDGPPPPEPPPPSEPIPEPASLVLLGVGLLAGGVTTWRRNRK